MNSTNESSTAVIKNTSSPALSWALGILFAFIGLISLISTSWMSLGFIFSAIIIVPPGNRFFRNKLHLVFTRKSKIVTVLVLLLAGMFADMASSAATGEPVPFAPAYEASAPVAQAPAVDKEKAKADLDEVMRLAIKSTLVSTYEFSNKANVVFVEPLWYSMPVSFKKDFLAKIAKLKEAMTGYHSFEVRDAYSNEKVAEVTAFSGSLEVYK